MRIHTDANGLAVNAIYRLADGTEVAGRVYQVLMGVNGQLDVVFQRGSVAEHGVNGLTNEALLEIVKHRLCVLEDEQPSRHNVSAISCIEAAIKQLEARAEAVNALIEDADRGARA